MEQLKTVLSNILVQYILKVGGVVIGYLGLSTGTVTEIVTGIVGLLLGIIGQWIQVNTATNAIPPSTPATPSLNK